MTKTWLSLCVAGALAGVPLGAFAVQAPGQAGALAQGQAQTQGDHGKPRVTELGQVDVTGHTASGYATAAHYDIKKASLGPLGNVSIKDTPASVTVVPEALIVNQQAKTVNDVLRNLPSVEIRDQQGLEVSRPQSRGFQGTIVQNTRLDGLNVIGTTAIPAENLAGIQVLNGLAGSLYGPETPAGVFNYVLKRPTGTPLLRLVESFDSHSIFTEQVDASDTVGSAHPFGYRLNLVHGEGESYVDGSNSNRTLFSGAFDFHLSDRTVVEADVSHYQTSIDGLPGSIVYDSGASTVLPRVGDPARKGLGQPGAGTDLVTTTGLVKLRHDFGNGWNFVVGALHQNAIRGLYGITNRFVDDSGDYTVTRNFDAVSRFTITSNLAQLNGHFDLFGMQNDLSVGTNGFDNGQYHNRNSISTLLGSASFDHPVVFPDVPVPATGGRYKGGVLVQQAVIVGDTLHFDDRWAVQAVVNDSYLHSKSYNAKGVATKSDTHRGIVSPTVSLIYTPTSAVTAYATYSNSMEEGETAPTGTANANQFLSPYHDEQFEAGAKFALSDGFLLTADAFRMTRPLASTDAVTNVFAVVGKQRNQGVEVFAQGDLTSQLSMLGGISYVDAKLRDTGVPATDDKWVVGVPRIKSDLSVDYHPGFARGFALTGTMHFEDRRAATNTNNSFAPAYATFDVGARYSTSIDAHPVTLRAEVVNVTDKHYYSSVADGNIVGSPGANTAYFGAPRTYLASLEIDI